MSGTNSSKFQGFPKLDSPMVDAKGNAALPWYFLFITLWNKTGGSLVPANAPVFLTVQGNLLQVFEQSNPIPIGEVALINKPGAAAQPVDVSSGTPFVFTATQTGTMVVFGAQVELSRDSGVTFFQVTLTGGAIPILAADQLRITWFGTDAPPVTFFPSFVT